MSYFNKEFFESLKFLGIYILSYTLTFIVVLWASGYFMPFIIAFLIALLIQPMIHFLKSKLKLKNAISTLITVILIYLLIFYGMFLFVSRIVIEANQLLQIISSLNQGNPVGMFNALFAKGASYLENIDPALMQNFNDQTAALVNGGIGILGTILKALLSFVTSIPMIITVVIFTIIATYFLSRDMDKIKKKALIIFSEKGKKKFETFWSMGIVMGTKYLRGYFFIYSLTFIQTWIGFSILGVKYALLLSIITAVFDVLPILGITMIYLPTAIVYLLLGNYFTGIGIIVVYVLISIVRQIVEPKIVSSSLNIHPVVALATIYIGLKVYGLLGIIYFTFMIVIYNTLRAAGIFIKEKEAVNQVRIRSNEE